MGLAAMLPMRPRTGRFKAEQVRIDAWVDAVVRFARHDPEFATEVAQLPRVLKGYGATHKRGGESFERLMAAADRLAGTPDAASALARLRTAALADEPGASLEEELQQIGEAGAGVDGAPRPRL